MVSTNKLINEKQTHNVTKPCSDFKGEVDTE